VHLYLVHHGEAVGPDIDVRRPLSAAGRASVERLAEEARERGVKPEIIWHSGKLRTRQTAEAFWRVCNPFAELAATRDVQPGDPPAWLSDRLRGESREILIAGHFPHLPALLDLLTDGASAPFPAHGIVALASDDDGATWRELWRSAATADRA
jgi:phosphohistidine phosphatase